MKNYIVYSGSEMVRRFETKAEAIQWVDGVTAGFSNYPAPQYRVCYNGHTSVQVYASRKVADCHISTTV
jgi:hypothetical protein